MRILRAVLPVIAIIAIGLTLAGSLRAIIATAKWYRILNGQYAGGTQGVDPAAHIPDSIVVVAPDGKRSAVRFGGRTAVILVFDANCSVCNKNTPRWLDLLAEVRHSHPNVPVYALPLTPDSMTHNRDYWRGLEGLVTVMQPVDAYDAQRLTGVGVTPATIILKRGVRVATQVGFLGLRRREFLLAQLNDR